MAPRELCGATGIWFVARRCRSRASRPLVRLVHLPAGRNAEVFAAAAQEVLATVPERARWTLTSDQGATQRTHGSQADPRCAEALAPGVRDAVDPEPATPFLIGVKYYLLSLYIFCCRL